MCDHTMAALTGVTLSRPEGKRLQILLEDRLSCYDRSPDPQTDSDMFMPRIPNYVV